MEQENNAYAQNQKLETRKCTYLKVLESFMNVFLLAFPCNLKNNEP